MVSLDLRHLHEISDWHMDPEFSIWTSEWQAKLNVQTLWEIVAPHSIEALRLWNWHINTLIYHVYDIVYPCVSISIEFECVFFNIICSTGTIKGGCFGFNLFIILFPKMAISSETLKSANRGAFSHHSLQQLWNGNEGRQDAAPFGALDGLWLPLDNVSPTMQDERCHNHVGSHGRRADFPLAPCILHRRNWWTDVHPPILQRKNG